MIVIDLNMDSIHESIHIEVEEYISQWERWGSSSLQYNFN